MADHVKKQLRDALVTRLTGLATTGARVHRYRANPLQSISELPALVVQTPSDSAVLDTIHTAPLYERRVEVTVLAYASANATLDDTLDLISKDVEVALGSVLTFGSIGLQVFYDGSETDIIEGERNVGELSMRFHATMFHEAAAPDVLRG
jgi:hypothetical protein